MYALILLEGHCRFDKVLNTIAYKHDYDYVLSKISE